jgi:hypothetical protein
MAYFPTSPLDGASVTVNGILYTYNASKGAWKRVVSSINNLDVAGNITASGNISSGNVSAGAVYTTSGLFWAGNGVAFSSGGSGTPGGNNTQIQFNDSGSFNGANITFNKSNGNLVISSVTDSTSATTGALTVAGGAGIAGNVYADRFYTASGIYWSGNGAAYAAGGGSFTSSATAPVSPTLGSFWYKTTTDVLYEYINDGTTSYWVDIQTQTIASNTSAVSTFAGTVFGANITFTGSITGTVGYLIERANVVVGAAPAVTNLDLITAPILYFTSNTTQNITANIRGNSTITLNSLLAIGQSTTFVIFVPNATAYYVNTVRVDNTVVTPYWQGGLTITGGNANSIDIYTFAVLKTANATFKVFASQVKYQNLGP